MREWKRHPLSFLLLKLRLESISRCCFCLQSNDPVILPFILVTPSCYCGRELSKSEDTFIFSFWWREVDVTNVLSSCNVYYILCVPCESGFRIKMIIGPTSVNVPRMRDAAVRLLYSRKHVDSRAEPLSARPPEKGAEQLWTVTDMVPRSYFWGDLSARAKNTRGSHSTRQQQTEM